MAHGGESSFESTSGVAHGGESGFESTSGVGGWLQELEGTRPATLPVMRARKIYATAGLLLLSMALFFAGPTYVWATRPIASEAQLQEAAARVAWARSEPVQACPRPVLRGVALSGDGAEGVRSLLSAESLLSPCFTDVATRFYWYGVVGARVASAAPLPFEGQTVVECAGLDTAVQALLQRASGCTAQPLSLDVGNPDIRALGETMVTLARGRVREGHLQEGAELLLDVIRLGQDFGRGPASIESVRAGQQTEGPAALELEALLASDLPWTSAMLDELARQARVLAATTPEPTTSFQYDEIRVRQHALDVLSAPADDESGEEALVDIAAADYGDTRWPECTAVTPQTCIARYRAAIEASGATGRHFMWIPGVERQVRIQSAYADSLRDRETVLTIAAGNEALLRALVALFLHRRMSLSGSCPSAEALQAEAIDAGLGASFEVTATTQAFHPFYLRAAPDAPRVRAYCPALREQDAGGRLP